MNKNYSKMSSNTLFTKISNGNLIEAVAVKIATILEKRFPTPKNINKAKEAA